jgi:hypothetical protein
MANNYTQFSFCISDLTPAEASWLKEEYAKVDEDNDYYMNRFALKVDGETAYLYAEDNCDLDRVVAFVQAFLKTHRPDSSIGFEWAETCSKPRPGEFGGGAILVTATTDEWMSTGEALDILRSQSDRRVAAHG